MSSPPSALDPNAIANELEALYTAMSETRITNYMQLSSIAFLIYDVFITFDKEYEYVWRSRWSLIKSLYFFARYYSILYNLSWMRVLRICFHSCAKWFWWVILGGDILFTTLVNIVLIIRIHAMYFRNGKVAHSTNYSRSNPLLQFELYASVKTAILTEKSVFAAPLGLPWPGCFAYPDTNITLFSWIPTATVGTIFFIMTLATLFRHGWTLSDFKSMRRISPLLVSFVQDGVIFYFFVFAIVISDMLMVILFKSALSNLLGGWLIAVYSMVACRLVINIRETYQRPLEESMGMYSTNIGRSIAFRNGTTTGNRSRISVIHDI
ncbi:hypothetical protein R3P38DRAFT_2565467 [Favolaschia claudopus]|uniref:DUF6533 domain-containing protein n=1 Tax=Favolaschia claudopus TaxID=2862362 RepID=A0AAW0A0C4_9AGAR